MGGAYSLWGAVIAALLLQLLPALLNNWGVSADWLTILFGIGVLQVLTTAPAGWRTRCPRTWPGWAACCGGARAAQAPPDGEPADDRGRPA